MGQILKLYNAYRSSGKGIAKSADEIKAWATKLKPAELQELGITDVEKAFISPRDNEPYVIVPLPMGQGPILAYEKTGKSGKHLVINTMGAVREVSDSELKNLLDQVANIGPPPGMGPGARRGPPGRGPVVPGGKGPRGGGQ